MRMAQLNLAVDGYQTAACLDICYKQSNRVSRKFTSTDDCALRIKDWTSFTRHSEDISSMNVFDQHGLLRTLAVVSHMSMRYGQHDVRLPMLRARA